VAADGVAGDAGHEERLAIVKRRPTEMHVHGLADALGDDEEEPA